MAKILIVDDDGDLRTLLGLCFLRRGHSIVVASNGAAALECLAVHEPDLLVTDVNMPVMGGLELLRRLRANGQIDLPVILLTACSDLRAAATEAGADAFLVKPVPLRELAEVAERLLRERRAPRVAKC
ncbi:MAG TPA: response regulator [Anaerolineae bacterium]|nr:response regulator [Anaerolineae bacterium]